jgi:hypothetical protein
MKFELQRETHSLTSLLRATGLVFDLLRPA